MEIRWYRTGTILINSWPLDFSWQTLSSLRNLTEVNGLLYFTFETEPHEELWKSDGTAAGTSRVKTFTTVQNLVNVNGTLFFSAGDDVVSYQRLWKSDGTVAGTVLVKDISAGAGNPYFVKLFNANGTLFFTANDQVNGEELWKSDGTEAGTVLVKNIEPGPGGSSIKAFAMISSQCLFFCNYYSKWK